MRQRGKKSKEVVISFAVSVEEQATNEDIASRLEKAITGLGGEVQNVSNVQVRTVPRMVGAAGGGGAGGYETRLWEKVTCDIFGGRLQTPGDPVELQEEVQELSTKARELNQRIEQLAARTHR
jgi:hypothetical protein